MHGCVCCLMLPLVLATPPLVQIIHKDATLPITQTKNTLLWIDKSTSSAFWLPPSFQDSVLFSIEDQFLSFHGLHVLPHVYSQHHVQPQIKNSCQNFVLPIMQNLPFLPSFISSLIHHPCYILLKIMYQILHQSYVDQPPQWQQDNLFNHACHKSVHGKLPLPVSPKQHSHLYSGGQLQLQIETLLYPSPESIQTPSRNFSMNLPLITYSLCSSSKLPTHVPTLPNNSVKPH
jgi:hypothetical protein